MREEHSSTTGRLRELSPDELRQVAGGWGNDSYDDHKKKHLRRHKRHKHDD